MKNNVMRHQVRVLTDKEKEQVKTVKDFVPMNH